MNDGASKPILPGLQALFAVLSVCGAFAGSAQADMTQEVGGTPIVSYAGADPRLSHRSGHASGSVWETDVSDPTNSYIVYGPYATQLPSGNFVARFALSIDNSSADTANVIELSVNDSAHNHQLMSLDVRRQEFGAANVPVEFDVPFYVQPGASLEFRVYYHCCSAIQVRKISVYRAQLGLPAGIAAPGSWPDGSSYPRPSKSWMIGVSETFAHNSSHLSYKNIAGLPGNTYFREYDNEAKWVADLKNNHHVGLFRDVVVVAMLAYANGDDQSFWPQLLKTMDMFRSVDARLVVDFSYPLPQWMIDEVHQTGSCTAVRDLGQWPKLKEALAWGIGRFLAAAAQDPARRAWMESSLYLEPLNEVDNAACGLTPVQSAELYNGIAFALNHYGVHINVLSPSLVNNNPAYMDAYYKAGGGGLPNVHIYMPLKASPAAAVAFLGDQLAKYQGVLPANLKERIFLTETGIALSTPQDQPRPGHAAAIMDDAARQDLYRRIIGDARIESATEAIIFWRLYDLPMTPGAYGAPALKDAEWEAFFGIVNAGGSAYTGAANGIFDGIKALH